MSDSGYKSFADYVHSFGCRIKDLSPEMLGKAHEEYERIKRGDAVFDGVLESIPLTERFGFKKV